MNSGRVWAIIEKEWLDALKNKAIVISMVSLPLLLVSIMLVAESAFQHMTEAEIASSGKPLPIPPELAALGAKNAFLVLLNDQFALYLMLIPIALPSVIAAHSIAGERESRSLEPLLATPIGTGELLLGKSLAAAAPAALVSWMSFLLAAGGTSMIAPPVVFAQLVRPAWTLGILLLSPLLALASTLGGIIASSRFQDPRAAQSVTGIFVVPLVGAGAAVISGKLFIGAGLMLGAAFAMTALNAAVLWMAVRLFRRETILTRWK